MSDPRTHGTPAWMDLSTSDVEAAIGFYTALLGWTVTRAQTPMGLYAIGAVGELEVGGMMEPVPVEGMPAFWTVFFTVDDVDATVAAVEAAGGTVLEPAFDLPDARIAVVADPTGATFGLIRGLRADGAYLDQGPGTVRWVELLTRDLAAAETFYAQLFGWKATTDGGDDEGGGYTIFSLDDAELTGMMLMPEQVPAEVPAYWSAYFAVGDVAASVARSAELGGSVVVAPMEVDGDRFAVLEDPQGAVFGLLQPSSSPTPDD